MLHNVWMSLVALASAINLSNSPCTRSAVDANPNVAQQNRATKVILIRIIIILCPHKFHWSRESESTLPFSHIPLNDIVALVGAQPNGIGKISITSRHPFNHHVILANLGDNVAGHSIANPERYHSSHCQSLARCLVNSVEFLIQFILLGRSPGGCFWSRQTLYPDCTVPHFQHSVR